ncbi:hypothetical protein BOX15_Mlig006357g1 [Macrostomum lignano]|uniref:BTB domain-containing protein n=1 Tax=Macrostomum lignano TaxID=282301 RepID=A0A267E5S7_9PLAT|nr:hypothetical protein BOX15_Mlig006357g1 [Macrostomum lignano]
MEFVTLPMHVWLDTDFFSADWTIVLNSQKAFRVNRKVLARYSRYFYKLFASAIRAAQPAMTAVTYSDPLEFRNLMAYLHYIDEHRDSERVPTETDAADDRMNEQFLGNLMQDADLLKRRLSLAKHFEIPFLIDAIVSTAIKKLSPYNCWMVMTTAVDPECTCKLLYDFAKDFILEHFVAATEQPQFVKLCSGEQLCELIDSKYLNVPAEIVIFDVICRWIETEQLDRSKYFCDLVRRMRHFMITDAQLQEMSAHHLAKAAEWESILSTYFGKDRTADSRERQRSRLPRQAAFLCCGSVPYNFVSREQIVQVFNPILSEMVVHSNFSPATNFRTIEAVCLHLDNLVYVIGGVTCKDEDCFKTSREVHIFDLRLRIWRPGTPLSNSRTQACGCVCDGLIYVMGGTKEFSKFFKFRCSSLGIVEQYNPATGLWRPRQNMLVTRVGASAASLNGMVYVCMGAWHSSMERYDCQNDQWTLLTATLPVELVGFALVAFDNCLYAIGGGKHRKSIGTKEVYCYNAEEQSWSKTAPLLGKRMYHSATVLNDYIYVFGGKAETFGGLSQKEAQLSVQRWNPSQESWTLCKPASCTSPGTFVSDLCFLGCCTISGCDYIEPLLNH